MTRAVTLDYGGKVQTRDYGGKAQTETLRPGPLRPANIIRAKFPTYKNGLNGIVVKLADGPEMPSLKETVTKETADMLDHRQRLSVRELAMKFEKGLNTATLLSNEVQTLLFSLTNTITQCYFCFFFLENAGELRLIILRREKGARALQHTPHTTHTTQHNSQLRKHNLLLLLCGTYSRGMKFKSN